MKKTNNNFKSLELQKLKLHQLRGIWKYKE